MRLLLGLLSVPVPRPFRLIGKSIEQSVVLAKALHGRTKRDPLMLGPPEGAVGSCAIAGPAARQSASATAIKSTFMVQLRDLIVLSQIGPSRPISKWLLCRGALQKSASSVLGKSVDEARLLGAPIAVAQDLSVRVSQPRSHRGNRRSAMCLLAAGRTGHQSALAQGPLFRGRFMLKVGMIVGSTRQNRFADTPVQWLVDGAAARTDLKLEVLDLRNYPLPFYNEPAPQAYTGGVYTQPEAETWRKRVG
jgi:NADPH-dependent FMN reductase